MKNSKFIFVPMRATSVFIFSTSTASAEEGIESTTDTNIEENVEKRQFEDKNTYEEQTSVQQTQVPETENDNKSVESSEKQSFEEVQSEASREDIPKEETYEPR